MTEQKKTPDPPNPPIRPLDAPEVVVLGEITRRLGPVAVAQAAGVGAGSVRRATCGERLQPAVRTALRAYIEKMRAA